MSNPTNVDYMGWKHGVNHVMYILGICEQEHDLGYVQEAKTSKDVWDNLGKMFVANMHARNLHLRQKFNNIQ